MAIRSKKFNIIGNSASITSWNDNSQNLQYGTILLTEVKGWDEFPEIIRNKVVRNFGNGEYYSSAATFSARVVEVSFFAEFPEEVDIRNLRSSVRVIGQELNNPALLTMTYYTDDLQTFKETLYALPETDYLAEWKQMDNSVEFTLVFRADNPMKTVYVGANTVAEIEGRI